MPVAVGVDELVHRGHQRLPWLGSSKLLKISKQRSFSFA